MQPEDTEQDQWCRFCFGDAFMNRLKQRRGEPMSTPHNNDEGDQTKRDAWANGIPPLLSIMAFVNQVSVM